MVIALNKYKETYFVNNRKITTEKKGDRSIHELLVKNAYIGIIVNHQHYVLSLEILFFKNNNLISLPETKTIEDFIINDLTSQQLDGSKVTNVIPVRPIVGNMRFQNRLKCIDPHTVSDINIAYTSMRTPDKRDDPLYKEWANDLVIFSETEKLNNSLVAINGLFHRTVLFKDDLYVAGGYANMKRSQTSETLLCDTSSIGGHIAIPITEDMVIKKENVSLKHRVDIKLPDEYKFTNKTAAIVFHGRLLLLDDTYKVTGPSSLKINTNIIDIPHWLLHHPMSKYSRTYRTQNILYGAGDTPANEYKLEALYDDSNPLYSSYMDVNGVVDTSVLTSDEMIKNLLVHGQSFIILFNNPKLYIKEYELNSANVKGQYEMVSEDTPRGLLMYNNTLSLPFTILTSKSKNHLITVNTKVSLSDIYKTTIDQTFIPAPWKDIKDNDIKDKPAIMIELYSAV